VKLICKCGNIQDLNQESENKNFTVKDCEDGTLAIVCSKCEEIVFIKLKE
jgi:hypothetical protein